METYERYFCTELGVDTKRKPMTFTAINNIVHIILKGCKPRPVYRNGIHEQMYYLKKDRKTKEQVRVYIGY